jgi:TATA-box binding protein (TBP) (component of TFIID and TFIIIB)
MNTTGKVKKISSSEYIELQVCIAILFKYVLGLMNIEYTIYANKCGMAETERENFPIYREGDKKQSKPDIVIEIGGIKIVIGCKNHEEILGRGSNKGGKWTGIMKLVEDSRIRQAQVTILIIRSRVTLSYEANEYCQDNGVIILVVSEIGLKKLKRLDDSGSPFRRMFITEENAIILKKVLDDLLQKEAQPHISNYDHEREKIINALKKAATAVNEALEEVTTSLKKLLTNLSKNFKILLKNLGASKIVKSSQNKKNNRQA